ncbi:IS204/IS1001/IS1096/IS1165 transposase [Streptococcus anginosus]|uniref:IS204/IS1001/IS1096/IS1165 transposase n=1 Tax=Streptococcus anginosus TaxID=1328 RepID=A0A4V0A705_STRAP|nr:transposase [Streptococcus anginosus]VTS49220.1 IS204/IS1001/IS1096/IS1165 transposase [Streptococcus anginosus]
MEQLDFITKLLGIEDKNIKIDNLFDADTHKEILAHLDYDAPSCPACKGQMAKYDFQKPSKIPYLETAGYKTLIRLKKRRFRCKNCGKMAVAETSLVQKNHQIAVAVKQKIAQLLVEKQVMTDIAHRLSISTSTVIRKLSHKRFYRPAFRSHLTNQEILHQLLSYSDQLRQHYELYQLLLFHFQEKQTNHFFDLIEEVISDIHPIFQTVFRTFLKDRNKITNALELPYSNAKLEATNNLIKVIKRNAFGFRNFDNFKKRILIALNIKRERTNLVLSKA